MTRIPGSHEKSRAHNVSNGFPMKNPLGLILYCIDDRPEGIGVVHGQVGQGFPIDGDIVLGQFTDKDRVGHSVLPHTGIDTGNPETPEVPFLGTPVAIGIRQSFFN